MSLIDDILNTLISSVEGTFSEIFGSLASFLGFVARMILFPVTLFQNNNFIIDFLIGLIQVFVIFNTVALLVVEMFIIGLTVVTAEKDEQGNINPFTLVYKYLMYHVSFIKGLGALFLYFINLAHKIIDTLKPV